MAKTKEKKSEPAKMGRPTEYDPIFCKRLIDHMKGGNSFESFGAIAGVSRQTLYNWEGVHPDFLDSKKVGLELSLRFFEDLGKAIATGQLRRLKAEWPIMDKENKPVLDPNTGQVLMHREYEPATAGQSTWIFMMKNMHRWRDRVDMNHAGQSGDGDSEPPPPIKFDFTGQSIEDLEKELAALLLKAKK